MPIKTTRDGRTIRTGKSYTDFRRDLYEQQNGICCVCPRLAYLSSPLEWDDSFHVAHRGTRGAGGCFRDDVVGPNKGQVEGGKCGKCHREEHNERNHPTAAHAQ